MKLAIIVAVAKNGVIGVDNKLPWHLPQDLKYFKAQTLGKPIVMGRKTFESIGRPLPGRTNIVLTRDASWVAEGVNVALNVETAMDLAEKAIAGAAGSQNEVMIIGGAELYRSLLPQVTRIYLTSVDVSPEGDAFFPELSAAEWRLSSVQKGMEGEAVGCEFRVYERLANN
jgi:dihydrofolate reductase